MTRPAKELFDVLLVEDSEEDRLLLKDALRQTKRLQLVAEAAHGAEAVAYFQGRGRFHDREKFPLPDLLLLDLKMPVMDGFAVLDWLRAREFPDLTVVVLTASVSGEDIKRALDCGADLFQVKPRSHRELETLVLALEDYMLRLNAPAPVPRPRRRLAPSFA